MKITSKAGNGNKVHIYIDGEYTLTLYDDYWYCSGYKENQEISDEQLASLKEEAGFRLAYEKGIQYLSIRAYSVKEMYNKLKMKYGNEASNRAIDKLLYRGYLDDEAFANMYVRQLFEIKKYDFRRISYELHIKGISSEIAENALKTLDNEPILRIIDMLESKFSRSLETEKDRRRIVNRLVRMGYSYTDIRSAFSQLNIDMPNT